MGKHSTSNGPYIVTLPTVAVNTGLVLQLTSHLPEDLSGHTVELDGTNTEIYAEGAMAALLADLYNSREAQEIYVHNGGPKLRIFISKLKDMYYQ